MKYILLIYGNESDGAQRMAREGGALLKEYGAFTESIRQSGQFVAGERLKPVAEASTVKIRDGKTLAVDGPFAETKEQLGGYYLIDVESQDEAIEWAAKIPSARFGKIEVRPLVMREAEVEA